MQRFITRHAEKITGVLSGFDRVVFRGILRQLSHVEGLSAYLHYKRVLLRDFATFVEAATERLKVGCLGVAEQLGRPYQYLASSAHRKEDLAREILAEDPVESGLICVFGAVEPCRTFSIYKNRERKRLELRSKSGKCLHLYHYRVDETFGFMSVRVQTWFPFLVQVCINGREWLARTMNRAGVRYHRDGNCFPHLSEPERAQRLMDRQLRTNWPKVLSRVMRTANPAHGQIFRGDEMDHYWTTHQVEWATDLMFRDHRSLAAIYPALVRHGIQQFASPDVLRFLGRRTDARFPGEIVSSYRNRPEGVRVKHGANGNSIKVYDKRGSILRVETTVNNPRDFRTYRTVEGDVDSKPKWRQMRKSIADLHRLTTICQAANERYFDALGSVSTSETVEAVIREVCKPTTLNGRRVRGLRPWDPSEVETLRALNRGEFSINGLRNRDLVRVLFPNLRGDARRRAAQKVTRLIRIMRAHGILKKVATTHRYTVTSAGRRIIGTVLASNDAPVDALLQAA